MEEEIETDLESEIDVATASTFSFTSIVLFIIINHMLVPEVKSWVYKHVRKKNPESLAKKNDEKEESKRYKL